MNRILNNGAAAVLISALLASPAAAQDDRATIQLTVADAVRRAIEHNPDLSIVRLDTEVEASRVAESRGAYAPVFSTTIGRTRNVTVTVKAGDPQALLYVPAMG